MCQPEIQLKQLFFKKTRGIFTIQHFCKNLSGDGVRDLIGSANRKDIFLYQHEF
jgi:hypothetical protein